MNEEYRDDCFYIDKINRLREEKRAVILAHNYQRGEVQDIADFNGDSLELSRKAAKADAEVIIFCGVNFMAESAAVLSPDRTVLIWQSSSSVKDTWFMGSSAGPLRSIQVVWIIYIRIPMKRTSGF